MKKKLAELLEGIFAYVHVIAGIVTIVVAAAVWKYHEIIRQGVFLSVANALQLLWTALWFVDEKWMKNRSRLILLLDQYDQIHFISKWLQ